ncbi:MAG TPA: SUMF1/EgtB/PvdO family nonheme iron enzyme [Thermoanaerobaculia bacterium]
MEHHAFPDGLTREALLAWYRAVRARTREIFAIVKPDAFYERPIPLRNPVVFYEGHLPGFSVNTLVKQALGRKGVDAQLERLFARGIDPGSELDVRDPRDGWPEPDEVRSFADACDALVEEAITTGNLEDERSPLLRGGEVVFTILEHELMHQETLLYMLHNFPFEKKRRRKPPAPAFTSGSRRSGLVRIPPGTATLGAARGKAFGWDNEFPSARVSVAEFEIDVANVTNGDYLDYMAATGAPAPHFWIRDGNEWYWRGMFERSPLPVDAPVYVTCEEASAYAKWRDMRLPTEAEYQRAAYGTPSGEERIYPWGDSPPQESHGNFDFRSWDPVAAGSHPDGASAWGIDDLVGNGWEWTSTLFGPFDGFEVMASYPQYSRDFFDGAHFVMKGASPVTARELLRPSFRNWFRPNYPYVYATFRCVR